MSGCERGERSLAFLRMVRVVSSLPALASLRRFLAVRCIRSSRFQGSVSGVCSGSACLSRALLAPFVPHDPPFSTSPPDPDCPSATRDATNATTTKVAGTAPSLRRGCGAAPTCQPARGHQPVDAAQPGKGRLQEDLHSRRARRVLQKAEGASCAAAGRIRNNTVCSVEVESFIVCAT